jgi:hypothetical protein
VSADAVHLVVDSLAFAIQLSFDPEGRKFIGNDAKAPARSVCGSSIVPEGDDLRRGPILVSFTERAEAAGGLSFLRRKIRRPPASLGGDDYPPSMDGIFSQFRHD